MTEHTQNNTDYTVNDHDLLISMTTKLDIFLNIFKDVPQKCVRHDEENKKFVENHATLVQEVKEMQDAQTWATRYAITSFVGIIMVLCGYLLKYLEH